MRHGDVAYFDATGRPLVERDVGLTGRGREQAAAARDVLEGIAFDRVVTSGLPRTVETARIVVPHAEIEEWPDLQETRGGRLEDITDEEVETAFTHAFRGIAPLDARFLGGESNREFLDRVIPALERFVAEEWETALAVLHGGTNRAILSYALTGERMLLANFEQEAGCINIVDIDESNWIVRTAGYAPLDPLHEERATVMERYLRQYLPYRRRS
jgi:broad specificity phosphatase PhoE